jgi:NAD(P) transhydrogenase subunit alpha
MEIGILKERNDTRVALIPEVVKKLTDSGNTVRIETTAGVSACASDEEYQNAGAKVCSRQDVLTSSDLLLMIQTPELKELETVRKNGIIIGLFDPRGNPERLEAIRKLPLTAFSLELVPRSTIAQSMDVLSSMASIAGYRAVLMAAYHLPQYFPMLITSAGSIPPAKALILGAGVAGLQAIATARRLGASVEAFDVRSAAKEEVQSLGAKFVMVEGAKEDAGAGGYAVEQTEEYKQKQQALVQERAIRADVIISTAQIPGRKAPILITADTVSKMKPGSVIIDLASSTGGNCELTENDKIVSKHRVTIVGDSNLPAQMPVHASKLYGNNLMNFINLFLKDGKPELDFENEIIAATCISPIPEKQPQS